MDGDDVVGMREDVLSALLLAVAAGDRPSFARLFDVLGGELHVDRHLDESGALELWVAIWQEAPRLARAHGSVRSRLIDFAAERLGASAALPAAS